MPKVLNRAKLFKRQIPKGAVYVGRPSAFGNPWNIQPGQSRERVIELYREYLEHHLALVARVKDELRGKDLVCWCAPAACHADVLLEIANAQ